MNITSDAAVYHLAQPVLMRALAAWVHKATSDVPMPAEKRKLFLEQLVFGIATILDGKEDLVVEGERLVPLIAFADPMYESANVVDGTWLMDYAAEAVDVALAEESPPEG